MKPYLEQQHLWELITAEHKVLIETCESGNNHRYAIVGQNLAVERSVMEQNFSRPTWNHFLESGINLWSWPWNYWKVYVDNFTFKKIWDCWIVVCWIEVKSFASLLHSTNQWSKLVETTKTYPFKVKWDCWIAVRCCNWPLDGGWIPWWIATICGKYQRKGASTNQLSQRTLLGSLEWISLHFSFWPVKKFHQFGSTALPETLSEYVWYRGERSLERNSYGSRPWAGGQK